MSPELPAAAWAIPMDFSYPMCSRHSSPAPLRDSGTNKEDRPGSCICAMQSPVSWMGQEDGTKVWARTHGIPPTDESWPCTLAASLSHIHPALNARRWSTCVIATIVGTSCMPLRCLQLLWLHLTFKISLYGCTVSFILYIKKWSQEELQKIIQGYTAHTWKNSCSNWGKLGPLLHCAAMCHVEMFLQN